MTDHTERALPALDGSRDLTQDEWESLRQRIAEEVICLGAAGQMITPREMRRRLGGWRAAGDQRLLSAEWEAGSALIALQKLGYRIVGPRL